MAKHHKRIYIQLILIGLVLLVPLIAMQFTNQVNWTAGDFAVAAVLLLSTAFALEIVLQRVRGRKGRIVLSVLIFLALVFIWAELAVGIQF